MNGVRIFISRLVARVELDDLLRCVFNQVIDLLLTLFRQGISGQAGILIPAVPGIAFFLRQRLQRRVGGILRLNKRLCTRGFRRKGIRLGLHIVIYPGFLAVFYLVVLQCVFGGQVDTHGAIAQYIVKNRAVPTITATQIGGNRVEYILVRIHRDLQVYHLALVKLEVDLIRLSRTALGTTHIMGLHGDDALPNFIGIIPIGIFRAYEAIVERSPSKLALIVELDYISIRRNLSINSQFCLVPLIDVMVQSIGISRAANANISIRQIALLQSVDQFIIDGRTHIHSRRFFVCQFIFELILGIQYLNVVLHLIGSDLLLPLGIQVVRFCSALVVHAYALANSKGRTRAVRYRVPADELISRAFRKPRRPIVANGNYAVIDELGFLLRGRCRFGKVGMVGQFHSSRLTTPLSVQGNLPSRIGIFRCNQQLIARLVHISTAIRSGIPT